jgi:ribonuclease P protein component
MLKKTSRLTKKKDFDAAWKNGRSSFNGLLGIKLLKNNFARNRYGIMVGLKVSKKAVERNKIKRRLREIIRAQESAFAKGFDFVITVLPPARQADFLQLQNALIDDLKKIRMVKK